MQISLYVLLVFAAHMHSQTVVCASECMLVIRTLFLSILSSIDLIQTWIMRCHWVATHVEPPVETIVNTGALDPKYEFCSNNLF